MGNFAFPPQITKELGEIPEQGQDIDTCVEKIKIAMKYSLRTMHPYFLDKLYAGSDPIG